MKERHLSALDDLEGGWCLSPVGASSVAQDSYEEQSLMVCRKIRLLIDEDQFWIPDYHGIFSTKSTVDVIIRPLPMPAPITCILHPIWKV